MLLAPPAHRLAEIYVDTAAIESNVQRILQLSETPLMAVVKADSFGHGDVAATALAAGASWIGVASLPEAIRLRAQGIDAPMLSWLNPVDADWEQAILHGIDVAVAGAEQLYAIAQAARQLRATARVHLHLDVGMSREGTPREQWSAVCLAARAHEQAGSLRVVGLMGHLSTSEDPASQQNAVERLRFANGVRVARGRGLAPTELHLAATAGALHLPDARYTLTRVGAGLYGIDPAGVTELQPALTLTVPVAQLRAVGSGVSVGYGGDFVTSAPTTLAVLPVGYGDGLPRAAQGVAEVSIRGHRYPIVGRISMDQVVVDVGQSSIAIGDIAVVLGPGGRGEPTVREWAAWAGTIENELVVRLGMRHSRVLRTAEKGWAR